MKKQRIKIGIALALCLLLSCAAALAAVPSPSDDFYVLDQANVLTEETEGNIVLNNDALYAACGAQIVVVTVSTTGSTEIEDYAYELGNQWGIGSSQGKGVLALLAIDDDDYCVLQGRDLESTLTSGALSSLTQNYLEPYFARKDYDSGVNALFAQLFARVAAIYNADVKLDTSLYSQYVSSFEAEATSSSGYTASRTTKASGGISVWKLILIAVAVILIVRFFLRRSRRRAQNASAPYADPAQTYTNPTGTYTPPTRSTTRSSGAGGSFLGSLLGSYLGSRAGSRSNTTQPRSPYTRPNAVNRPSTPTPPRNTAAPRSGGSGFGSSRSSGSSFGSSFGSLFGGSRSSGSSRSRGSGFGGRRSGGGGSFRGGGTTRGR